MNTDPSRLSKTVAKELRKLDPKNAKVARLLEVKIYSSDGSYYGYVQILIALNHGKPRLFWRKFKANSSLSHGETLWEDAKEYDLDIKKSASLMISERAADLAQKAKLPVEEIFFNLEMERETSIDQIISTRDSEYSVIVRISKPQKRYPHI